MQHPGAKLLVAKTNFSNLAFYEIAASAKQAAWGVGVMAMVRHGLTAIYEFNVANSTSVVLKFKKLFYNVFGHARMLRVVIVAPLGFIFLVISATCFFNSLAIASDINFLLFQNTFFVPKIVSSFAGAFGAHVNTLSAALVSVKGD